MSNISKLDLSAFDEEQRQALEQELQGAVVVITDGLIKAYRDGKELEDAHLDLIGGPLRIHNEHGYYSVGGNNSDQAEQKPSAEMTNLVSDIWAKRTGRMSDADAVARLKDVYSHRQAQFTHEA